jgi:hypothetical protein
LFVSRKDYTGFKIKLFLIPWWVGKFGRKKLFENLKLGPSRGLFGGNSIVIKMKSLELFYF